LRTAVLAVALGLATAASTARLGPGPLRLELGAFEEPFLDGPWSGPERVDVDPQAAADGVTSFYHRGLYSGASLRIPVAPRSGGWTLALRGRARVRSAVVVFVDGQRVGELLMGTGPWDRYTLDVPQPPARRELALDFALRPLPLVTGDHGGRPEVRIDFVEVAAADGLRLAPWALLLLAVLPAAVVLAAWALGCPMRVSSAAGASVAAAAVVVARAFPFAALAGAGRLYPVALVGGLATAWLLGRAAPPVSRRDRAALAGVVFLGTLVHGAVAFAPNHNPPDLGTHIARILDLGRLPLEYDALLRYGSHLPTESQSTAPATDLFGERALVPYSPLPNVAYYALHRLGAQLRWSITVLDALLAMAVAPWLWWVAGRVWDRGSAWRAALLYVLDLAVWHHVGRVHAPAAFGGALGTLALLYLADRSVDVVSTRRVLALGAVLGFAVLGYSSLVVLFGLFGAVLLVLLAVDARALPPAARRGTALALVVGGLLAGALFYFHYVPGILRSAGAVEADPDIFSGRTFLIFHNEGRQSLRIWRQGYWVGLFAGLLAAPFALRRARPDARPVLVAWFAGWALLMLLKEPFLFPRLLRWAKEDQFLSPLLCLSVGAGIAALPARWMRWAAGALAVAGAWWLQAKDYATHLDTLWQ
jgi:hypothetical protein